MVKKSKSKVKKLTKKESKVIEKSLNKEVVVEKTELKNETVAAKQGNLTFKKNKANNYDIFDKNKKHVAELHVPFHVGMFLIPTWAVWRLTIEDKNVLEEVFANLDSALAFIQKKFSKK